MSKERAVRRAERLAESQKARRRRERAQRRRALLRRLGHGLRSGVSRLVPRRRPGRLASPLTRAERAAIVMGACGALAFVWLLVDEVSTRIALTAVILLCAPVLIVLTVDRRT